VVEASRDGEVVTVRARLENTGRLPTGLGGAEGARVTLELASSRIISKDFERAKPAALRCLRMLTQLHGEAAPELVSRRSPAIGLRNEAFRVVRALSASRYDEAIELLGEEGRGEFTADALSKALEPYYETHSRILTDPRARAPVHCRLSSRTGGTRVEQVLVDPDGHNDWAVVFEADSTGRLRLISIGDLAG
jgi:hypothetical protein